MTAKTYCHIAGAITDSPKDDVRIHEFIAEAGRISGGTWHRLPVCRAPSAPRGASRAIVGSVGTLDDLDRQAVLMGPGMKLLENG